MESTIGLYKTELIRRTGPGRTWPTSSWPPPATSNGSTPRGCTPPSAESRLQVTTLIVWGTGDESFSRKWAYWLRDTIPGASQVVEIDGARLFFRDERATEFTTALRRHWDNHP